MELHNHCDAAAVSFDSFPGIGSTTATGIVNISKSLDRFLFLSATLSYLIMHTRSPVY